MLIMSYSFKDELDVPKKLPSLGSLSPNLNAMRPSRKSGSLGSINSEVDAEIDHDDIMTLTHNVRSFSEALQGLKGAVTVEEGESLRYYQVNINYRYMH